MKRYVFPDRKTIAKVKASASILQLGMRVHISVRGWVGPTKDGDPIFGSCEVAELTRDGKVYAKVDGLRQRVFPTDLNAYLIVEFIDPGVVAHIGSAVNS